MISTQNSSFSDEILNFADIVEPNYVLIFQKSFIKIIILLNESSTHFYQTQYFLVGCVNNPAFLGYMIACLY